MTLEPIKPAARPRIGLYSVGLAAYWDQFPGLRERLTAYGRAIEARLSAWGDVHNAGLVDSEVTGRRAGEALQRAGVDIVFLHAATYCTASAVLPVHQICPAPAVVLNLQPAPRLDYERTTTGEWLAQCGACPVPEFANSFERAGIPFRVVNGLLGLDATPDGAMADEVTATMAPAVRAWTEIEGWAAPPPSPARSSTAASASSATPTAACSTSTAT